MSILEKEVTVTLNGRTVEHYEKLGYEIPRVVGVQGKLIVPRSTKIKVKVDDLLPTSAKKVTKICDDCGKHLPNKQYQRILDTRKKNNGKDRCHKCANQLKWEVRNNKMPYERSLEYYALNNNKQYLLDEYSEKNIKPANQVFRSSSKECHWKCNQCGSDYDMPINKRVNDRNCPYCSGVRVNETNNLWLTHPEIAKLLSDPSLGYQITGGHNGSVEFTCQNCGSSNEKIINNVTKRGFNCSFCDDAISFPEKVLISVLEQLGIEYFKQKVFGWSKRKIYDFYIPSKNMIIETHGDQHYRRGYEFLGGRSLKEEQENDRLKEKLACENGIRNYIVLDCRKSELKFIKKNLLKSELNKYYNLKTIDWKQVLEYACGTYVKLSSDIWNEGIRDIDEIGKRINVGRIAVKRYLEQAATLGWCDYESTSREKRKIIQLTKDGEFIKEYEGVRKASKELGIYINNIYRAAIENHRTAGGYKWMYKEDYKNK